MNSLCSPSVAVPTVEELLCTEPASFVKRYPDIAAVNLACAQGLDNAGEEDYPEYLALIDTIAEAVKHETERCQRIFKLKPAQFHHSEAVFRVFTMEHIFRVRFNIKYDPLVQHRIEFGQEWDSTDSTEVFINGILSDKRTGTCSSLPTFAIAVGRRLGYPLKLVLVPNHTLYRWDDGKELFNYQHTESGGDIQPDSYFLKWPRRWTEYDYTVNRQTKVWLHSMTPTQEVSKFLCNRAILLSHSERYDEAIDAIEAAKRFNPVNPACGPIGLNIVERSQKKSACERPKNWRELVDLSATPAAGLLDTIDQLAEAVSQHFPGQSVPDRMIEEFDTPPQLPSEHESCRLPR